MSIVSNSPKPRLWDRPVPSDDERFKPFTSRDSNKRPTKTKPSEASYDSWSGLPNPQPFASFGSDGVTASVSGEGDLMQFSAYLGTGTSGMFSVDQSHISEPFLVEQRMRELLELGRDQAPMNYGLEIPYYDSEESSEDDYHNDPEFKIEMSFIHDRWPRYEYGCINRNFRLTKQWMVHKKTVLQACLVENVTETPKTLSLRFHAGMRIRDLEYLNVRNEFNDSLSGHILSQGPNDYSCILSRFCEQKAEDKSGGTTNPQETSQQEPSDAIAVVVSVFVEGKAVQWGELSNRSDTDNCYYDFKDIPLQAGHSIEVTTAYRMLLLPGSGNRSWEQFLISPDDADVDKLLAHESRIFKPDLNLLPQKYTGVQTKSNESIEKTPHDEKWTAKVINFLVRRSLWHILSVCSIPIRAKGKDPQVALTCGDISGHRVCTAASFFAFDFLLEVAKLIPKDSDMNERHEYKDYLTYIRNKIADVCVGHLAWLSDANKTTDGCFSANYWVSGSLMVNEEKHSYTPDDALADTAFQIIKFVQFSDTMEDLFLESQRLSILKVSRDWMMRLARLDLRHKCAWPRSNIEGCDKYRLSDHVWIWRASKARRSLLSNVASKVGSKSNSHDAETVETLKDLEKRLESPVEILKRFTTQNDISSKRMLATTRSPRETRFLLHASDTALFYDTDLNLFSPESPFSNPWENMLQAQVHHVDASQTGWDNSITYALALMIAIKHKSINEKSPMDLAKHSLDTLFGLTGSHGLFYGQIDETTKKPAMFKRESDKDWYFQASFEIPFILVKSWSEISDFLLQNKEPHDKRKEDVDTKSSPKADELVLLLRELGLHGDSPRSVSRLGKAKDRTMKKHIPFNSRIDQSSIVELTDEWLYNYPSFLTRDSPLNFELEMERVKSVEGEFEMGGSIGFIVGEAANLCGGQVPRSYSRWSIVDVPKKTNKRSKETNTNDNYGVSEYSDSGDDKLWGHLSLVRKPETTKKRFIWLREATKNTALVCTLASPTEEVQAISLFFDRYSHCENHFIDDVSFVLNTWESELHLSFYQLVNETNQDFERGILILPSINLPGELRKTLIRASMSFRFQGDFFDRYWTCHLIESTPNDRSPLGPSDELLVGQQGCLRQRKVLELHLLDRMLESLTNSTKQIFENTRESLGLRSHDFSFSVLNSNDYFTSSKLWQQYTQMLQNVEDEVFEALSTIDKWDMREKDRGQEQPRWTRNDESKYRPFIRKLEGTTRRRIRELRKHHSSIKSLRETLVSNQDRIRDDLGLRGDENIRVFTYVTVIFLPLGFAASVFSMNGAPPGTVLRSMVIFAVIALILTVTALVNAKRLRDTVDDVRKTVDEKSKKSKMASPLTQIYKRQNSSRFKNRTATNGDQEGGSHDIRTPDSQDVESSIVGMAINGSQVLNKYLKNRGQAYVESQTKDAPSWHVRFWFKYICLEFPARRVLIACKQFKEPKATNPQTYTHIICGILLLPFFAISYIIQILLYNIGDLIRIWWNCIYSLFSFMSLNDTEEEEIQSQLQRFVSPSENYRPLWQIYKKIKEQKPGVVEKKR